MRTLNNLPSRVFYGVNNDRAIALRLLGVPRTAAPKLAREMDNISDESLTIVRKRLRNLNEPAWQHALGDNEGKIYRKVWRILEGLD